MHLLLLYGSENFQLESEKNEDENEEGAEEEVYNVTEFIIDELENDQIIFSNEIYNKILKEMKQVLEHDEVIKKTMFTHHSDPEVSSVAINLVTEQYELSENWEKHKIFVKTSMDQLGHLVMTTILPLKSKHVARKLRQISDSIKDTTDEAEMYLLQQEYYEMKKISILIDHELNRPFNH